MLAALHEAGLSERAILAAARLPSQLFADSARRLPAPDYLRLWHAIRTVSGDPNIGITLARLLKPEWTEPLLLAILSAASVIDAVSVLSRYKRLLCAEDIAVDSDAGTGRLTLTYRWPPLDVSMPQVGGVRWSVYKILSEGVHRCPWFMISRCGSRVQLVTR